MAPTLVAEAPFFSAAPLSRPSHALMAETAIALFAAVSTEQVGVTAAVASPK